MSDTSKRWVGVAFALLAAAGLAATELVDRTDEWEIPVPPELESAGAPDYESAGALLPAVSVEFAPEAQPAGAMLSDLRSATASVTATQPLGRLGDTASEVLPVSRLTVGRDDHFALTAAAADVFDSYYRAYPASSDAVVRGRIILALLDGLPPRAADEAISALDDWRAAREAEHE